MNETQFALLLRECKPVLLRAVAETLDPRHADAFDDVVQETLLRAWRQLSRGRFRGDSKASTWLYTIAGNEARRANERLGRERRRRTPLDEALEAGSPGVDGLVPLPLDALDAGERELALRVQAGESQGEIAESMGIAPGTVKSRLFRLREKLARALAGKGVAP